MIDQDRIRLTLNLTGTLQGVGFRPACKLLADEMELGGWVRNLAGSVRLKLEGPASKVDRFMTELLRRLPPMAHVHDVRPLSRESAASRGEFRILESDEGGTPKNMIPTDLAACSACLSEVLDSADRRYGYPFTTCTRCGPRYTTVKTLPYDRERTTLSFFPLCSDCREEYENPKDRRFHAQNIACPRCGPKLRLTDPEGGFLPGNPLPEARAALATGGIVGLRGIGGFQLAVDALNGPAVAWLRRRKNRPHKALAVMARNIDVLRRFCEVSDAEHELMASPRGPIVVCNLRPAGEPLPMEVLSPDTRTLGAMLVTSPLHQLLFHPLGEDPTPAFDLLVMTSGNRNGEPICISNEEAHSRLYGTTDLVLCHNRDITLRNDDSLCIVREGLPQVWRRSRGYAPEGLRLQRSLSRTVLAMGADLKNTIALGYGREVVLSPHIGDVTSPEALEALETMTQRLPDFLGRDMEVIATDLHPDMQATRLGLRIAGAKGLPVVQVQHHHAHAVACLSENDLDEGLALVFDGTGLGIDGRIWGSELLDVSKENFARLASFAGVPLPGGDAAIRDPRRQLVARLVNADVEISDDMLDRLNLDRADVDLWTVQGLKGINAPASHGAGRLFDAFSAALGLVSGEITYEGQAAVRLESLAGKSRGTTGVEELPFTVLRDRIPITIDWSETFRLLNIRRACDASDDSTAGLAMAFHRAVARSALEMALFGRELTGKQRIALTGGVFMNRVLTDILRPLLEAEGFSVLMHRSVPPNDGGISLGQAVIAGRMK